MKIINLLITITISSGFLCQQPYVGGNDPNFLMNNPNLTQELLLKTKGKVSEACKTIPGIGQAVLSLRQYQQTIEALFDNSNADSFVKLIYFKEFVNPKTKQMIYKAVFHIKTFSQDVFVGIEALYKPQGYPSFEVLSYIMDDDLDNIKLVLKDQNIDPEEFYACGDLKEIFSRKQQMTIVVDEEVQQGYHSHSRQDTNIYYDGHPRDIKPDPLQPYNVASTRVRGANADDPKYRGIDN